jgi:hypothetical protein
LRFEKHHLLFESKHGVAGDAGREVHEQGSLASGDDGGGPDTAEAPLHAGGRHLDEADGRDAALLAKGHRSAMSLPPAGLHATYTSAQRSGLLSVADFVEFVRGKQK